MASGVPLKTVHREIDQGPLKAARKESRSKRALKEDDLFYLVIANRLDTRLLQLTAEGKDRLHEAIVAHRRRSRAAGARAFPLFDGGLSLDMKSVLEEVRSKLMLLDRARKMVAEDPEIRGGEPCIRAREQGSTKLRACSNRVPAKTSCFPGIRRFVASNLSWHESMLMLTRGAVVRPGIRGTRRHGERSRGLRFAGETSH